MGLDDREFWIDLGERVLRNELQALAPLFAIMASTHTALDWHDAALSALYVFVWTIVKNVAGVQAAADAPQWKILLDRVGSAVAGSVLSTLPQQFWGFDHWDQVGWTAASSALLALVMLYGTKPSGGSSDAGSGMDGKPGGSAGQG